MRKIHQKNCTLPMADAGAAASMVKTTQITEEDDLEQGELFTCHDTLPPVQQKKDGICTEGASPKVGLREPRHRCRCHPKEEDGVGPTLAEQARVDNDTLSIDTPIKTVRSQPGNYQQ